MAAFIIAGIIFGITVLISVLSFFAEAMADTTGLRGAPQTAWIFGLGSGVSAMVLATHWLPNIGW